MFSNSGNVLLSYAKRSSNKSIGHQLGFLFGAADRLGTQSIRSTGASSRSLRVTVRTHSIEAVRSPSFVYKIAAAYSGKNKAFDKIRHYEDFEATREHRHVQTFEPHKIPQKNLPSGQDSYFISDVGRSQAVAFGVVDGVGGYADQGIDSSGFSSGLSLYMKRAAAGFSQSSNENTRELEPLQLLKAGYNDVCADRAIIGGGSTACLGIAGPKGTLNVAK